MKTFQQLATILASTALLATACKKNDTNNEQPVDNGAAMMTAFFKQHAPQTESFTVNATTGGVITSTKGIKYYIPANSLLDGSGNPVTGNVTISVREITAASEMILGDKPAATGNGQMLQSFGEFRLGAQQGNQNLKLKNDSAVRVQAPVRPNPGVQLPVDVPMWAGDSAINTTLNGYNHDNQNVSLTQTVYVRKGISWSQIAANYAVLNTGAYNFRIDSFFTWRNCDALYNPAGTKTTVMGYLGDKFNTATGRDYMGQEPSMLFFKVKNQNTIVKLYDVILQPAAGKEGLHSYQQSFTVGEQGSFLAISAKNGKFYAEIKDVTIAAPAPGKNFVPYSFNLQEVTQTQLLSLVQQMDTK